MIYGIDVSNWQGTFNWGGRSDKFAVAKATEGTTYVDAQFARNWSQMANHKLVRGAYHFGHPANDAVIEAEHFLTVVRGRGLHDGDLLALDLESADGRSPASVAAWSRRWCAYVQQQTGIRPLVYTFISFAENGSCAGLGAYPLWIAAPSYTAGKPPMPLGPWSTWAIHQYTDNPIDKDVSNLTVAQLRALGGAPTPEDDDMTIRTSVSKKADQVLPWNTNSVLTWDVENADPDHTHWDGNHPGYIPPVSTWADFNASVRVDGLQVGDWWQLEYQVYDDKKGKPVGEPWTECAADQAATSGNQYCTGGTSKGLTKGQHVYVALKVFPGGGDPAGRPAPKAVSGRWTVRQDAS